MTTITRKQFVSDLSNGGINVNELSKEMKARLSEESIGALKRIAGADGRISGAKEMSQLFDIVDSFDGNQARDKMDTATDAGVPTPSGAVFEELKAEVERNRVRTQNKGIVHLGMRAPSVKEAEALKKTTPPEKGGVTHIAGSKSKGVVDVAGKKFDLTTPSGLDEYRKALTSGPNPMPKPQAERFVDFLAGQRNDTRDELAELGLQLFQAGEGKTSVSRLVLSGHGDPTGVVAGEGAEEQFLLKDIQKLAAVFPRGAEKIEHVAVSACFGASQASFDTLRAAFPNMKSAFAYNSFAPLADGRAPSDLRQWASMTSGDPSQVDPTIKKTATWNVADGTQGLPQGTVAEMESRQEELAGSYDAYVNHKKDPALAEKDSRLDEYYNRLADLYRNPALPAKRKEEVLTRLYAVLELRHPPAQ